MSGGGKTITVEGVDATEQAVVRNISAWVAANPDSKWQANKFYELIEECESNIGYIVKPLATKYKGFSWVVSRMKSSSFSTSPSEVWIPIAGYDGCTIVDGNGSVKCGVVGDKKYTFLGGQFILETKGSEALYLLWLSKMEE